MGYGASIEKTDCEGNQATNLEKAEQKRKECSSKYANIKFWQLMCAKLIIGENDIEYSNQAWVEMG